MSGAGLQPRQDAGGGAGPEGPAYIFQTQSSPRSGLDPAGFDRAVRPQDDLYRYVNGGWLARTKIPPERASYAAFIELADKVDTDILAIVEELRATTNKRYGSAAQQVGDLYASLMDEARLERHGGPAIKGAAA